MGAYLKLKKHVRDKYWDYFENPYLVRILEFKKRAYVFLKTFNKSGVEKYLAMERIIYSNLDSSDDKFADYIVGNLYLTPLDKNSSFDNYPFEKYLLRYIKNTKDKIALDYACGADRQILRMAKYFKRVDGADISLPLTQVCKRRTKDLKNPSVVYNNNGFDLRDIASDSYDFVYSTVAFQHIAPYDIRRNLLKEFLRILKPKAKICLQMVYTEKPRERWKEHVDWLENPFDALSTNGSCDAKITPNSLNDVKKTFEEIGFKNFNYKLEPLPYNLPEELEEDTNFIYLYAEK